MSITFRIATAADDQPGPVATINARQLAAFRAYLREQGQRLGLALLDPDSDQERVLALNFEARICPLAIAATARIFDYDEAVIAVLDEAQFRSRRVTIWWYETDRVIRMRVSPTSDAGVELDLATDSAHALLESLAIRPDDVGEIPVDAIRARLSNPAVRRRADAEGTTRYLDQLDRLVSYADTDSATRLEWA
ncbi:hypothetical protein [Sphingobium chlorophenolicum]|uniref:Uncharacterized protein n=1 Tax=Sphingobium chlorophenolicum TaxID=46429 RepID=A0A081REX2_SPHCR|nr:hypothetical protein [Sphingobium chlorophenolicum]KEQ53745.1 hypothetical protein BV95_01961 [Sphingobium chlorophenolicum]